MRQLLVLLLVGCGATAHPSSAERQAAAAPAVTALQAGKLEDAAAAADAVLRADRGNPQANATRALTRYITAMGQLRADFFTVIEGARHGFNHEYMRASLEKADHALADIEDDLAHAADDPDFALELCLACWEHDWNRNGRIDDGDRLLFQIELDADGKELPENDPRRKPTFRFDAGDISWARAMVDFQRAFINLILAYRWNELDRLLGSLFSDHLPEITIKLDDAGRVRKARELILAGLDQADRCRQQYLAETDDDREWVPNPRQKNHPLPLPVDQALYDTWEGVVGDLRRLLSGEEGLDVAELAQLGDHKWEDPPRGYIDIGKMFSDPKDLVFDFAYFDHADTKTRAGAEDVLRSIFGETYVKTMKASPLVHRLMRMKKELDHGDETFERKLRYLLWLN
jgi:hypothetical protein